MHKSLFSNDQKVALFDVIKEINEHLHHIKQYDKVEDIKEHFKKLQGYQNDFKKALNKFLSDGFNIKIADTKLRKALFVRWIYVLRNAEQKEDTLKSFCKVLVLFIENNKVEYINNSNEEQVKEILNIVFKDTQEALNKEEEATKLDDNTESTDNSEATQTNEEKRADKVKADKIIETLLGLLIKCKSERRNMIDEVDLILQKIKEMQKARINLFNLLEERMVARGNSITQSLTDSKRLLHEIQNYKTFEYDIVYSQVKAFKNFENLLDYFRELKIQLNNVNIERNKLRSITNNYSVFREELKGFELPEITFKINSITNQLKTIETVFNKNQNSEVDLNELINNPQKTKYLERALNILVKLQNSNEGEEKQVIKNFKEKIQASIGIELNYTDLLNYLCFDNEALKKGEPLIPLRTIDVKNEVTNEVTKKVLESPYSDFILNDRSCKIWAILEQEAFKQLLDKIDRWASYTMQFYYKFLKDQPEENFFTNTHRLNKAYLHEINEFFHGDKNGLVNNEIKYVNGFLKFKNPLKIINLRNNTKNTILINNGKRIDFFRSLKLADNLLKLLNKLLNKVLKKPKENDFNVSYLKKTIVKLRVDEKKINRCIGDLEEKIKVFFKENLLERIKTLITVKPILNIVNISEKYNSIINDVESIIKEQLGILNEIKLSNSKTQLSHNDNEPLKPIIELTKEEIDLSELLLKLLETEIAKSKLTKEEIDLSELLPKLPEIEIAKSKLIKEEFDLLKLLLKLSETKISESQKKLINREVPKLSKITNLSLTLIKFKTEFINYTFKAKDSLGKCLQIAFEINNEKLLTKLVEISGNFDDLYLIGKDFFVSKEIELTDDDDEQKRKEIGELYDKIFKIDIKDFLENCLNIHKILETEIRTELKKEYKLVNKIEVIVKNTKGKAAIKKVAAAKKALEIATEDKKEAAELALKVAEAKVKKAESLVTLKLKENTFNKEFFKQIESEFEYLKQQSEKHSRIFNSALNTKRPFAYTPYRLKNDVFIKQLDGFEISEKVIKLFRRLDNYLQEDGAAELAISEERSIEDFDKTIQDKDVRKNKLAATYFDIRHHLEDLKINQYDVLNRYLHSSGFFKVSDILQVYGGAFGIWDQETKKLVRIQDRRYCQPEYRPFGNHKWFDFAERMPIDDDENHWNFNPFEESVDLMFFTERRQLQKPEFYQNLSQPSNTLTRIEQENQCLFVEDGEMGAFILLYRFLDAMYHTEIRDDLHKYPEPTLDDKELKFFYTRDKKHYNELTNKSEKEEDWQVKLDEIRKESLEGNGILKAWINHFESEKESGFNIDFKEKHENSHPRLICLVRKLILNVNKTDDKKTKKELRAAYRHFIAWLLFQEKQVAFLYNPLDISDSALEMAYDDVEAKARREKYYHEIQSKMEVGPDSFYEELQRQGLIEKNSPNNEIVVVTERYVNLCKFILNEINGTDPHLKVKCNYNVEFTPPLNPERYFIDRRLKKYQEKDPNDLKQQKKDREKYLEKINASLADVVARGYTHQPINKEKFNEQISKILLLLLESVEPLLEHKESTYDENHTNNPWKKVFSELDQMSNFPIKPYYILRSNQKYAISKLVMPIAQTVTNKEAPNVGFIMLSLRNVIKDPNGQKVQISQYDEEIFKKYIYSLRAVYQPLILPLMDKIYYDQIMNKTVMDNAMRAGVARVLSRNMSHNIGSHVLGSLTNREQIIKATSMLNKGSSSFQFLKNDSTKLYGSENLLYSINEVANLINYLRERMDFIADISTGEPLTTFTINLDEVVKYIEEEKVSKVMFNNKEEEINLNPQLLKHLVSGIEGIDSEKIKILLGSSKTELNVSFPNDILGRQAFYIIIENIIRNTVKHNPDNKDYEFTIFVNDCTYRDDLLEVKIIDTISAISAKDKVNRFLNMPILSSESKEVIQEGWGIMEMKIAAAYLRKISITQLEQFLKNDKTNAPILSLIEDQNSFGYKFYLLKPTDISIYESQTQSLKKSFVDKINFDYHIFDESLKNNIKTEKYFNIKDLEKSYSFKNRKILFKTGLEKSSKKDLIELESITKAWLLKVITILEVDTIHINITGQQKTLNLLVIASKGDIKVEEITTFKTKADYKIYFNYHNTIKASEIKELVGNGNNVIGSGSASTDWKLYLQKFRDRFNPTPKFSDYHLLSKLVLAGITDVAIIDERVQKTVKTYDDTYASKLSNSGIYIPDSNKLNLNSSGYKEEALITYLKGVSKAPIIYILIHIGVIESFVSNNSREEISEKIISMSKRFINNDTRFILVSGRGTPPNLPEESLFINASSILRFINGETNKIYLVDLLNSICPKYKSN